MTRVKICGITRMEDAEWALECGASALGFVWEPSSPRYLGESPERATIPHRVGLFARCVAVFATLPPKLELPFGYAAVQAMTGNAFPENHWAIRSVASRPGLTVEEALEAAQDAHGILLDGYDPNVAGGSGKLADWGLAAELAALQVKPVLLAGGLTPDNVADAVSKVKPTFVDVSSGVESGPGVKDRVKVRDFIQAARSAGM